MTNSASIYLQYIIVNVVERPSQQFSGKSEHSHRVRSISHPFGSYHNLIITNGVYGGTYYMGMFSRCSSCLNIYSKLWVLQ